VSFPPRLYSPTTSGILSLSFSLCVMEMLIVVAGVIVYFSVSSAIRRTGGEKCHLEYV